MSQPALTARGSLPRGWATAQIVLLDLVLYAALFWRDYSDPAQWLIAHYLSFVAITDLGAFFLPAARRHWFNLFRFTSGLSFLVLVLALAFTGLAGATTGLVLLQCALAVLRCVHAGHGLWKYGPLWEELRTLPAYAVDYFRQGNTSERMGCAYLLIGLGLLYFPQLAYWTHFNTGEYRLDAALTGLQAQAGLNFCIKLFIFEIMVRSAAAKLAMRTVIATLFLLQWPMMPVMFYLAPIPLVHGAVELYELALVIVGYRYWRKAAGTQIAAA